jgi:hypothetical protein
MSKFYATEQACALIEHVQLLPGFAGPPSFATLSRLFKDFQAFRMMEGTSDVHRLMIARDRNAHHLKIETELVRGTTTSCTLIRGTQETQLGQPDASNRI